MKLITLLFTCAAVCGCIMVDSPTRGISIDVKKPDACSLYAAP